MIEPRLNLTFLKLCAFLMLGFGLTGSPVAGATPTPQEMDRWLQSSAHWKRERRALEASALLLGSPYVPDPLGEGADGRYDQDPRARLDAFDCTTFVETVLALSRAPDWSAFLGEMDAIRYEDGHVGYAQRNHFTSLDWLPNQIRSGRLEDVTREVAARAGMESLTAIALIDKPRWYARKKESQLQLLTPLAPEARARRLREWQDEGRAFSPQRATIDYIPFEEFQNPSSNLLLDSLPSLALANLVRPNWDLTSSIGTHLNVSHQLIIFRTEGGALRVRHAASVEKRVIEEDFASFLRGYRNHPTARGLNFLRISAPNGFDDISSER